jgi:hypothetical protein
VDIAGPAPDRDGTSNGWSMSQIVENWAQVKGVVEDVDDDGAGTITVHLRLDDAQAVATFPNLLAEDVGAVIPLRVTGAGRIPGRGEVVACRVRKAGPDRYFADAASLEHR